MRMNKRPYGPSLAVVCVLLMSMMATMSAPALAAGRTYVPQNEDDEPKAKYETCRLKQTIREENKTFCVYQRQSRGQDVTITVDQAGIKCQTQFTCKRDQ